MTRVQETGRHETVFTLEATPIKVGPGASAEVGWELTRRGVRRVLVVSDPGVARIGLTSRIVEVITAAGIDCVVFDQARVEPTLQSLQEAADVARAAGVDGFVGVGGGSSLDTAKVADLLVTHPAPLLDYVNAPVGGGRTPPGPLRPSSRSPPRPAPALKPPPSPCSIYPNSTSKPASPTVICAPTWAWSIRC